MILFYLFSLYFIGNATGASDTFSTTGFNGNKVSDLSSRRGGGGGEGSGLSHTMKATSSHRALLSVTRRFASPLVVGVKSIVKYTITNVGNM